MSGVESVTYSNINRMIHSSGVGTDFIKINHIGIMSLCCFKQEMYTRYNLRLLFDTQCNKIPVICLST